MERGDRDDRTGEHGQFTRGPIVDFHGARLDECKSAGPRRDIPGGSDLDQCPGGGDEEEEAESSEQTHKPKKDKSKEKD
jgi:hypothetical protein